MKFTRIIAFVLALVSLLGLTACGESGSRIPDGLQHCRRQAFQRQDHPAVLGLGRCRGGRGIPGDHQPL